VAGNHWVRGSRMCWGAKLNQGLTRIYKSLSKEDQALKLSYVRLYSDDSRITHFADENIPWSSNYGILMRTDLFKADSVGFFRALPGWSTNWHPAPRRQLVMVLEGSMEEEVGDGEKRIFEPGSVLLVEDIDGKGHKTKVVGQKDLLFVWVPVSISSFK